MLLLLLSELLMLASCAQALKLSDFVPATEETQITCQQARKSNRLSFCVYFSIDMCKFQREAAAAIGLRLQVILHSLRVQHTQCLTLSFQPLRLQSAAHRLKSMRTVRQVLGISCCVIIVS